MSGDIFQKYGISFWNGALMLYFLNYWSEANVNINMQNYAILVALDVGRQMISNQIFTSLVGGWWGTGSM